MRARPAVLAVPFAVAVLLAACGGATKSDLFATDVPEAGGTRGPAADAAPQDDPPAPAPEPPDASGPDVGRDAGVVDTGGPPGPQGPSIKCGAAATCPLTDTCCAFGQGATLRFECRAGQVTCPSPSTDIRCDSAEDCAGKICCGDRAGSAAYNELSCRSTCNDGDVTFCDPATPAASCRPGKACKASTILRGYFACEP